MLIVPFVSSLVFMDAVIAGVLENAFLCLFKNNYTPIHTTAIGDLVECNFDGYARISLTGWSVAALDGNLKASTELPYQEFTKAGAVTANDVYGAFVLDFAGNLLYAERFASGPFTLSVPGQKLLYQPVFTDTSEF